MLDFSAVRRGEATLADLAQGVDLPQLHQLTDEMLDEMVHITVGATDADVVFAPQDPDADDPAGASAEANMPWTLGHVIVHATASSEEAAAIASTLARGVMPEGRSRYEVPWETIHTAQQVHERLEESRRMRHALLDAWPDTPHLDLTYTPIPQFGPMNATARCLLGLFHDDSHLEQLREIMRQARAARSAT